MKGIFDVAHDDEAIKDNLVADIRLEGGFEKTEIDPFDENEVKRLLESSNGDFRNFLGIAFYTGARLGEIIALTLNDIQDGVISINKAISRNSPIPTTPKTPYSVRKIPILNTCKPFVDAQIQQAIEHQRIFLFASSHTNKHYKDASSLRWRWKKLLKKSGVRHRKLYNTRHTFATAMLRSGRVSVLTLARLLGHSNTKMVITTYAGFIKSEGLNIDLDINLFRGTNRGTFQNQAEVAL